MSFKAEFRTRADTTFASNALRFATEAEAKAYGNDLFMRWLGAHDWRVTESDEPVSHTWTNAEGAMRIAP